MTKDEYVEFWGLSETEVGELLDADCAFSAGVCAGCRKVIAGATCNSGRHQPEQEYCSCWN